MTYQPGLPVVDPAAAARIRDDGALDWFHAIAVGDYTTPTHPLYGDVRLYRQHWEFDAAFLQRHAAVIAGATALEPGCADGLWTCWLARLGARQIDASDAENREQFRLIARAFGLPATYYPGLLSTRLPAVLRRRYDLVCSLGLLYHVHDPVATLVMYRRYLRAGGALILETAAIDEALPYLHFTGDGRVYNRYNQFLPTTGFLHAALGDLGMTVEDQESYLDGGHDLLGRPVVRNILIAHVTGPIDPGHLAVLAQLGMLGEPGREC